jgi:predicted dehydrogenase
MQANHRGRPLDVGIIGCGLIAQVMHLYYLHELQDRFTVRALCDLSSEAMADAARTFPEARCFERWDDLIDEPLDCVFVLTSGSHEAPTVAALEAGKHVFVEKPLCFSVEEGMRILSARDRAGKELMVGYMKRFDPAYELVMSRLRRDDVRLVRVTTLESPSDPYLNHYPLSPRVAVDSAVTSDDDDEAQRLAALIGSESPVHRRAYVDVLLQSMVHEFNVLRGLLGEPTELRSADVWADGAGVTATLAFAETECVCSWIELPGISRYEQEFAFYGCDERVTLRFPSPFLRNFPTSVVFEGGEPSTTASWRSEHVVSYEEAFKRELEEFHRCIAEGRQSRTPGRDALRDVALCQSVMECCLRSRPIPSPALRGITVEDLDLRT